MYTNIEKIQEQIRVLTNRMCANNEIFISEGTLSGIVPSCFKFGIDNTTGILYYKDTDGNWQPIPSSGGGGDFIPLSGTVSGSPVTGDIELPYNSYIFHGITDFQGVYDGFNCIGFRKKTSDSESFIGIQSDENIPSMSHIYDIDNNSMITPFSWVSKVLGFTKQIVLGNNHSIDIDSDDSLFKGISGIKDFTPNITDLDYPQKIYVDGLARPYKVYTALLTQSGTDNPTIIELENNLGVITITRGTTGSYSVYSGGFFTANKTALFITPTAITGAKLYNFIQIDSSNLIIKTTDSTGTAIDGALYNAAIEIRVYN